jgi:uncharacterized protein (TIGR00255 family)
MITSMTGFGKAICELENKKITIEVKTLNSKQLDLNIRIPSVYKEKELSVRNYIVKSLIRGKVELSFYSELAGAEKTTRINPETVKDYIEQLTTVAGAVGVNNPELMFQMAVKLPDTLKTEFQEIDETEWVEIDKAFKQAVSELIAYREQEGKCLEGDIINRIKLIGESIPKIEKFEKQRIENIRTRITNNLNEFVSKENIDMNRFEQEVIYYLEKFDITEEKVRLKTNCDYFMESIKESGAVGKKLGFISQEIGREINTIGSKANDSDMQKIVVEMKDELEKVKEQLMNVL